MALWLPKRGSALEEYEDAFARPGDVGDGNGGSSRWAVADGATEASFSREWARALVRAFAGGKLGVASFAADVDRLRPGWNRGLERHVGERRLPWYAQQKADLGAFAAFVGLELDDAGWRAVAVGDSNLFLVRGGRLHAAFPLTRADQFSSGPFLVGSRPEADADLARRAQFADGDAQPGDVFHLMSDALACWFLRAHECGEQPWQQLEALPTDEGAAAAFAAFVAALREDGQLHNDDVTLVSVVVAEAAADAAGVATAAAEPYWLEADETTPF